MSKPRKRWVADPTGKWNRKRQEHGRWKTIDLPAHERAMAVSTELFEHPLKTKPRAPAALRGTTDNRTGPGQRGVRNNTLSRRQRQRMGL